MCIRDSIHVDGSNSADIAWGINSLLENPEAAKAMGERGRVRVERCFTWDRTAKCTIDAYEGIIRECRV